MAKLLLFVIIITLTGIQVDDHFAFRGGTWREKVVSVDTNVLPFSQCLGEKKFARIFCRSIGLILVVGSF